MAYQQKNVLLVRNIPMNFDEEKCSKKFREIPNTSFRDFRFLKGRGSGYLTMASHDDCVRVKEALSDTILKITFRGQTECDFCGTLIEHWMCCPCRGQTYCGPRCYVRCLRETEHSEDCVEPPKSCECLKGHKYPQCVRCVCRKMIWCSLDCTEADLERHLVSCQPAKFEKKVGSPAPKIGGGGDAGASFAKPPIENGAAAGFRVGPGSRGAGEKRQPIPDVPEARNVPVNIAGGFGSQSSTSMPTGRPKVNGPSAGFGGGAAGRGTSAGPAPAEYNNPARRNFTAQAKPPPPTNPPLPKGPKHCMAEDLEMVPLSGKSQQVVVLHIETGKLVYVMPSEDADVIGDLNGQLNEHGKNSAATQVLKVPPPAGAVVLGKFSDEWFRGIVKAINGASVTLFFVDYGNTEETPLREIMPLPESAMKIPCFTVGVEPQDEIPMEFKEQLIMQTVSVEVIGRNKAGIPVVIMD